MTSTNSYIDIWVFPFNKTRVKVMNQDKKNYNKLKKYWKLLLKDRSKINRVKYNYHRPFKKLMREIDIIHYLLDLDGELKASYELYHHVRYCLKTKDFELLKKEIFSKHHSVSRYMKTAIQTIKKYMCYIENTFKHDYNNGVLEGINNLIKTVKRIAFGYKSYYHFRNRILIVRNLAAIKKA